MTAHIIQMRFPAEPAPSPYAAALDDAVEIVARRVATGSTLTHRQHLSIWLDHPSFIPLVSIRGVYWRLSQ